MYIQIKHKLPLWAFQPELVFTGLKKHLLFIGLLLIWPFSPLWLRKIAKAYKKQGLFTANLAARIFMRDAFNLQDVFCSYKR